MEPKQAWNVQLSQQAELDFSEILKWTAENQTIAVLRLLHERMDLARHVP